MFKRLLSTIGIGGVTLYTVVKEEKVQVGEKVTGEIHITGGKVDQRLDNIHVELDVEYYRDEEYSEIHYMTHNLSCLDIVETLNIQANHEVVIPFEIKVPFHCPISFGDKKVWLMTRLDVYHSVHPRELKPLNIEDNNLSLLLKDLSEMGYGHIEESGREDSLATIEATPFPFVQHFQMCASGEKINFYTSIGESGLHIYNSNGEEVCCLSDVTKKRTRTIIEYIKK